MIGAGALALSMAACDAGPSAVARAPFEAAQASAPDPRDAATPLVGGTPMWAANRLHTAQENADYQFGRNGKDFGALTEADYVAKAHRFVSSPPTGVEKVTRSNGDDLIYDPRTNTFAVVSRSGAPRTMFKPKGGETYWKAQVARESQRASQPSVGAASES
jgi:pyocin large subunit-like protein